MEEMTLTRNFSYQASFLKAAETVFSDNDVVKDFDADDLARIDEPPRNPQIFF